MGRISASEALILGFLQLEHFFEAVRSHYHEHALLEFATRVVFFDGVSDFWHVCTRSVIALDPRVCQDLIGIQALLGVHHK